jgi:acetoin:2,6-dichlorophenolindophenol oxidoreductase subunit alpha
VGSGASITEQPVPFSNLVGTNCGFIVKYKFSYFTFHQKVPDLAMRGAGYGIPAYTCDGNDIFSVYDVCSQAIAHARNGGGPSLINAVTYRISGHFIGDPGTLYRSKEEVEEAKKRDPLVRLYKKLIDLNVLDDSVVEKIKNKVNSLLEEAVMFAKESPEPSADDLYEYVYK